MIRRYRLLTQLVLIGLCVNLLTIVKAEAQPSCEGQVVARWLPGGRNMKLIEPLRFTDSSGKVWVAEKDKEVDGASIPPVLWSLAGGPFSGKYREASVIHDVECKERRNNWKDVHRMFLEMMLCYGVEPKRAYTMYVFVDRCGPRWDENGNTVNRICHAGSHALREFRKIRSLVWSRESLTIEELQAVTQEDLDAYSGEPLFSNLPSSLKDITVTENLDGYVVEIGGFKPGSSVLTNEMELALLSISQEIRREPGVSIKLEGFSDGSELLGGNVHLPLERARVLEKQLLTFGLKREVIDIRDFSEMPVELPQAFKLNDRLREGIEIRVNEF